MCVCVCVFSSPMLFKGLGVVAPPPGVRQQQLPWPRQLQLGVAGVVRCVRLEQPIKIPETGASAVLGLRFRFCAGCLLIGWVCAAARVIPDSGSSPSRDPEHFSGSRVGILPCSSLRLRIQRLWIPTRAGSPLGNQESVRQEISFSRQKQPAARQGVEGAQAAAASNVQRPASRATPSPRRRPATVHPWGPS